MQHASRVEQPLQQPAVTVLPTVHQTGSLGLGRGAGLGDAGTGEGLGRSAGLGDATTGGVGEGLATDRGSGLGDSVVAVEHDTMQHNNTRSEPDVRAHRMLTSS